MFLKPFLSQIPGHLTLLEVDSAAIFANISLRNAYQQLTATMDVTYADGSAGSSTSTVLAPRTGTEKECAVICPTSQFMWAVLQLAVMYGLLYCPRLRARAVVWHRLMDTVRPLHASSSSSFTLSACVYLVAVLDEINTGCISFIKTD